MLFLPGSWAPNSVGINLPTQTMEYALSVSSDSVTLSSGQFFGDRFRTVASDSFVCSEGEATGHCRAVPRHRHASSHFVLVVRGVYITEARNQDALYGPGTLIYNPTGTAHRDRFDGGQGAFLTITPSPSVARLLDACVPVPLIIHHAQAIAAAIRTRKLLLQDGLLQPELLDDCCLDLAGTMSDGFETETRHLPSWLVKARELMRDCCLAGITVGAVANRVGVHPVHLARAFRRYFHVSPGEYLSRCRISRARELLQTTTLPLTEIAIETGFSEQSHLTHAFRRETAMTPAAYRRLHQS